jgi:hypothetical protein
MTDRLLFVVVVVVVVGGGAQFQAGVAYRLG